MSEQNAKNHGRYVSGYHFIAPLMVLLIIVASGWRLVRHWPNDRYVSAILLVLGLTLAMVWFFSRSFALRAQDRAIRAEETLRYFIITGRRPDPSLRMGQFIALRFASDAEMPSLADRAATEKLSSGQIKDLIQSWRADNNRAG
jgi:hypothetical protein